MFVWTEDMDDVYIGDIAPELKEQEQTLVKDTYFFIQNNINSIDNVTREDYDKIHKFVKKTSIKKFKNIPSNNGESVIINHAFFIRRNGWGKYRDDMIKRKKKELTENSVGVK